MHEKTPKGKNSFSKTKAGQKKPRFSRTQGEGKEEMPEFFSKFGHKKKLKPISAPSLVDDFTDDGDKQELSDEKPTQSSALSAISNLSAHSVASPKKRRLTPIRMTVLGFLAIILVGTFFLALPISNVGMNWRSFPSALFAAVSTVCVTGMGIDINSFSVFGQIVVLVLIQAGGLGFMAVATLLFFAIRKRITLSDRLAMQEALNHDSTGGIVRLMRFMFLLTFAIEGIGAVVMLPFLTAEYGARGIFMAVFLAVSAFCNAGITIVPSSSGEMVGYSGFVNCFLMLIVAALVVLGGLGFSVIASILRDKKYSKMDTHVKLVLLINAVLLGISFAFFLGAEFYNPQTLGGKNFFVKAVEALFHAASVRTAGFSVWNAALLTPESQLFTAICMFVGASPASTGGGIKTTTLAILLLMIVAGARGNENITFNKTTISRRASYRAVAVMVFALLVTVAVSMLLMLSESRNAAIHGSSNAVFALLFEAVSALSTTGLSLGVTQSLSPFGLSIVAVAMFLGRIGPISIGMLFLSGGKKQLNYPETNIMIG